MTEKLTPQAAFLYEMLARPPHSDVSIRAIAIAMSGLQADGWPPRYMQQRVGRRISELNRQLEKLNAPQRAKPGDARRTYRLRRV